MTKLTNYYGKRFDAIYEKNIYIYWLHTGLVNIYIYGLMEIYAGSLSESA